MLKEIKSDKYMYDIENNILYYKEKNTVSYYHEFTHYLLNRNKNKIWYKINFYLSYYSQFMDMLFLLFFIFYSVVGYKIILGLGLVYLLVRLPIMIFTYIEEIICDINGRKLYDKHKRNIKNNNTTN